MSSRPAGIRLPRWRAAIVAIAISLPIAVAGCGCPAALLPGVLVAAGDELAVQTASGDIVMVRWPWGYGVRTEGDILVLTNVFGGVVAREGNRVEVGGGMVSDDRFGACGDIVVPRTP